MILLFFLRRTPSMNGINPFMLKAAKSCLKIWLKSSKQKHNKKIFDREMFIGT